MPNVISVIEFSKRLDDAHKSLEETLWMQFYSRYFVVTHGAITQPGRMLLDKGHKQTR